MTLPEYLYRFPRNVPRLTWEGLSAPAQDDVRRFGLHAEIHRESATSCKVLLYGACIAVITPEGVYFTTHSTAHLKTDQWISRIIRDHGLGCQARRVRQRDNGVATILCIDGDRSRPVLGRFYSLQKEDMT